LSVFFQLERDGALLHFQALDKLKSQTGEKGEGK
jgi:hypothetical protein